MEFRLLGPFEAHTDSGPIALGPPQQRLVLVGLLVEPGRVVHRSRLIDMLWPDGAPRSANNALQVYVSRLRSVLHGACECAARIETVGPGYRIALDPDAVDAHRFRCLVSTARSCEPAQAIELLLEALALWRGQPLVDLDSAWLRHHVCSLLDDAWLDAYEELFSAQLDAGHDRAILPELSQLFAAHPTRERLAGLLMRALYRADRRADALAVYRRVADSLSNHLGIEPSWPLAGLHLAMLRNDPRGTEASAFSVR